MNAERLINRWVHAREQDSGGKSVYRTGDYEPPPARGRTTMQFHADGTGIVDGPGPTDKIESSAFTWELADGHLTIRTTQGESRLAVETLEADLMILSPV